MTAPERLSDTAPWRDWFEKAMNSGAPIVDNAGTLHPLGYLEGDHCDCGTAIPGDVERCEECEEQGPDPHVCAACDHQRAFHFAQHDGLCFGLDCDCTGFEQAVA